MPRSRSEIFDLYAKLAEESGIVSYAEETPEVEKPKEQKDSPRLRKYKKSPYPRAGSDDISTIEALYGVKPDSSIKYEYNIMEAAHPKAVVIAPSYDKLNGLVENNNERNSIMCNIALKPTNSISSNHRYAEKDLMMQLVKIANDMDNRNMEGIRKLADECINALVKKKIIKQANPLVIIGIAAAVLAAVWIGNHIDYPDYGLKANLERAVDRLDELLNVQWFESDLEPAFRHAVETLRDKLMQLQTLVNSYTDLVSDLNAPRDISDMEQIKDSAQDHQDIEQRVNDFRRAFTNILPAIETAIQDYASTADKFHRSWLSEFMGRVGEFFYGDEKYSLFSANLKQAQLALNTLKDSIYSSLSKLSQFDRVKASYQDKIAAAQREASEAYERGKPKQDEGEDNMPESNDESPEEDDQGDFASQKQDSAPNEYDDRGSLEQFLGRMPTNKEIEFIESLK